MIKMNTPLKTLNLQFNALDHVCGEVIGESLIHNNSLLKLDLAGNALGDLGVLKLMRPIIK